MNEEAILDKLKKLKVIPVTAIDTVTDGLKLCELLCSKGLPVIEITFRTAAAADVIKEVSKKFPDMLIGAGTVLNELDLKLAKASGATFAVAPGCNPKIIKAAKDLKFPFFPGISNPSDIEAALETGVKIMKFFPAEACGGVNMLKAISAPYKHLGVKFIPTGGITEKNMKDYLQLPEIIAVGGTWLAKSEDMKAGEWDKIGKLISSTVTAIKEVNA